MHKVKISNVAETMYKFIAKYLFKFINFSLDTYF